MIGGSGKGNFGAHIPAGGDAAPWTMGLATASWPRTWWRIAWIVAAVAGKDDRIFVIAARNREQTDEGDQRESSQEHRGFLRVRAHTRLNQTC